MLWIFLASCLPLLLVLIKQFKVSIYRKSGFWKIPLVSGYIPFLGHITSFADKRPHHTLDEWAKQYGEIFRFKVFGEDIVVLNTPELIKAAFAGNCLAGRPSLFRIDYGFHNGKDVIFGNYNEQWKAKKKLLVQSLREFGYGSEKTERIVQQEVTSLIEVLRHKNGVAFDSTVTLLTSVVNALSASIMGRRLAYDSPSLRSYHEVTRLFSEACSPVNGIELDLCPWLRYFPSTSMKKLERARGLLDAWIDSEISETKAQMSNTPNCILESLLMLSRSEDIQKTCMTDISPKATVFHEGATSDEKDGTTRKPRIALSESDVRCLFIDLLVSGTFTTAIALNVFCMMVAKHQKLQTDIRAQIIGGLDGMKDKFPLLRATVLEILRYISHVPLSLPHYSLEDTNLANYFIPKSTQVLFNLWHVHHKEELWKDPWVFDPERFLEDGRLVSPEHPNRRNLIPFGGGRRACPGESLSQERIMTFASAILKNFSLSIPEDDNIDILTDPRHFQLGLILEPRPYKLKLVAIN